MNRTQAVERVDEILDLFAEMYVSGRCPRCEALLYDAEDKQLPTQDCGEETGRSPEMLWDERLHAGAGEADE